MEILSQSFDEFGIKGTVWDIEVLVLCLSRLLTKCLLVVAGFLEKELQDDVFKFSSSIGKVIE